MRRMATYSTVSAAQTAAAANADYDQYTTATRALDYISALRALCVLLPDSANISGAGGAWNKSTWLAEIQRAQGFVSSVRAASGVRRLTRLT